MEDSSAYRDAMGRVLELLPTGPDSVVPATPGWAVRDVVAHLSGLAHAWVAGEVHGYASDAWTAAQVTARRDLSVEDLAQEWRHAAGQLEAILDDPSRAEVDAPLITAFGPLPQMAWPGAIVTDLAVHEHDIRGALGMPGARQSAAVLIAMRNHVGMLRFVQALRQLPNLVLAPLDHAKPYKVGKGSAQASVSAPLFELFRATGGRRSVSQITAMDWEGDADPWFEHLVMPSYSAPGAPLVE